MLVVCFASRNKETVVDILSQAQAIPYLGMALSSIAHLLERAEQASSNKDECLRLLGYMSVLAKHMKNLDILLHRPKLDAILLFIVEGALMCARHMEANSFCRIIFAPLDFADLENLKSQLLFLYPDLALEAVTEVMKMLPKFSDPSQGEYPQYAVGVEEAQNKVIELIDVKDSSRRIVVIYGVGGIGKTTLATAVFNRLDLTGYHYCRVDMEQDSKQSDLQAMQEQILRDLFKENLRLNSCTHGRDKLSEAFGKASQLIFLFIDNGLRKKDLEMLLPIEQLSQLPKLRRILVTTRNLNETNIFGLQDGIELYSHRVDSLSEPEAKRVLCHYALGDKNGSFDTGVNMDGLLQFCGGIPLVLRIVGSHLRTDGNTVSACNEILEYHKKWRQRGFEGGEEDLSERMVDFVYRRLKDHSKEAFVDIVFFFFDWERSEVGDIVGEMELRDLERAALVTTSEVGRVRKWERERERERGKKRKVKVKVHDLVRARGRKLSEGNRISDVESLSTLLRDGQTLKQTKGIWLRNDDDELILEAKHVDLMNRSLRVLSLGERMRLNGQCERAFEDLRFLHISFEDMFPIDISKSRQLVYFYGSRLSEAKFTINSPESLKLLYMNAPRNFDIYGNFSFLKMLTLWDSKLERLPESFGNFTSLQNLYMRNCSMLEKLPEIFGNLSSLQELYMSSCSKLNRLPESIGNLSSLQELFMHGCSKLERLPERFGNLSSLQHLDMDDCSKLEELPESFGNLSSM